jgi:hypothetical protein
LLIDLLTPALDVALPKVVADYLRPLSREPWAFLVSGVIAALIVTVAVLVYFGIRRRDPDTGAIEAMGFAAFYSLEPFFLFTFIGLSAFVWMALLLLIVTQWFPYSLGSASGWIDSNSQFLLSLVVGLSLLTPIILHGSRVHRNRE